MVLETEQIRVKLCETLFQNVHKKSWNNDELAMVLVGCNVADHTCMHLCPVVN